MKLILILIVFVGYFNRIVAQQKKENPIVFAETFFGGSFGNAGGLSGGFGLNHQFKNNLFTIRYSGSTNLDLEFISLGLAAFPVIKQNSTSEEFSALYGLRSIKERRSVSFSAGISYNKYVKHYEDEGGQKFKDRFQYFGVPCEFNIKWYKKDKVKWRIYWIPIGKPTAFAPSAGLKIFGNISRNSYVGVGMIIGFGYHKKYSNELPNKETQKEAN